MTTPLRRFYARHATAVVALFVLGGLLTLGGYDAAIHTQQQQRAAATCGQIETLYDTLIRLVQTDGSFTLSDVRTLQQQRDQRVTACHAAA